MARKQIEQDDPWAGFVDVLSNVVMVVTFIIILLGIAMLVLSQQIAKSMAEALIREADQAGGVGEADGDGIEDVDTPSEVIELAPTAEATPAPAPTPPETPDAPPTPDPIETADSTPGSSGTVRVDTDRPLLQPDEIEGDTVLTVRSRDVEVEVEVAAAQEMAVPEGGVVVTSSDALATITYDDGAFELPPDTGAAVATAVAAAEAELAAAGDPDARYEIVAVATSSRDSLSEARRIAFYRGMRLRSLLLQAGVGADRIGVTIRESDAVEDLDKAWVFARQ